MIGSLLVILAVASSFGYKPVAVLGLISLVGDTGGLPWFLVATWHDATSWVAKANRE
jgi:hypothetical protein